MPEHDTDDQPAGVSGRDVVPNDVMLNTDELAAYEYVLFTRDWSIPGLATALDVSTTEAQAVVERLTERELLRVSLQEESRLVPASPLVGLGRVASDAELDLMDRTKYVHRLHLLTNSLMERFEQQRESLEPTGVEIVVGRDDMVNRVGELLRNARRSVDTVVTTPPTERALAQARVGDLTLLERGISVRGLYLEGHRRQSAQLREHLAWLSDLGAQVRVAGALPVRFMLIDETVAAVSVQADDSANGGVVVHSEGLVHLAAALFDLLWDSARGIERDVERRLRAEREAVTLDELEFAVLSLMAKGNKDLAVSRRTGLSVRSVRRVVAGLSERLGADSRFELGIKCRELGLI